MLQSKKLQAEMLQTSPPSSVHDVAFPHDYSQVFAACGLGEIRVWHLHSRRELLRMSVPNLDCRCVAFMQVCCLLAHCLSTCFVCFHQLHVVFDVVYC